jgi:hypothetical protein
MNFETLSQELEKELAQAADHQREKTLALARSILPGVTPEDIRNPQDFPKLMQNIDFQFEDGMTSGLISALTIIRRWKKEHE